MFTGIVEEMGAVRYLGPAQERDGIDLVLRSAVARVGAYGVGAYATRPGDSIAVNGVSLTIAALDEESCFSVQLVDHTRRHVDLGAVGPGTRVNVEVDVLGKYVEKLLGAAPAALVMGTAS